LTFLILYERILQKAEISASGMGFVDFLQRLYSASQWRAKAAKAPVKKL
jgi:hypothetical protein